MNCSETRRLLEADLDGELDLVRHLEVEAHLRGCPACTALAEQVRARRTVLRTQLSRFPAPATLRANILEAVRAETPSPAANPPARAAHRRSSRGVLLAFWQVSGLAACLALAVFAGFSWGTGRASRDRLLSEAVTDHVRSLQADHLMDVVSTDQHTVKPWFAGKTNFSPPVVDLASAGYPLVGGRLETLDGQTAAALVFHRRKHAINLFIWPDRNRTVSSGAGTRDGFQTESWRSGDLAFVAVSEIPAADLAQFAEQFRAAAARNAEP